MKTNEKKEMAMIHTELMQSLFSKQINASVSGSKVFTDRVVTEKKDTKHPYPKVRVLGMDTVSAIFAVRDMTEGRMGVLNFASYKEPGGKFMEGSIAQEECLCHESTLYNILSSDELSSYYAWNNQYLNKGLYMHRAIWTPDVTFIREDVVACDVITCAAPNKGVAIDVCQVHFAANTHALYERCKFVLDICKAQGIDTPILGAWGCGVFGQDAKEVAQCFKELLLSGEYNFETVVFAILPSERDRNLEDFQIMFA